MKKKLESMDAGPITFITAANQQAVLATEFPNRGISCFIL
jgi:hypothetical protein